MNRRESTESPIDQDKRLRAEAEERLASKFGTNVTFEGVSSASVAIEADIATEEIAQEDRNSDSDSSDLETKKSKKDWKKEVQNNE